MEIALTIEYMILLAEELPSLKMLIFKKKLDPFFKNRNYVVFQRKDKEKTVESRHNQEDDQEDG